MSRNTTLGLAGLLVLAILAPFGNDLFWLHAGKQNLEELGRALNEAPLTDRIRDTRQLDCSGPPFFVRCEWRY